MIASIFKATFIILLHTSSCTKLNILYCPELKVEDSVEVRYNDHRLIHSTASFHCSKSESRIDGPITVSCLPNGEWSENPPSCVVLYCPEIEADDSVEITYKAHRLIYSTANFHCSNLKLKIRGPVEVSCLPNGTWSENSPTCAGNTKSGDSKMTLSPEDDSNSSSSEEDNNSSSEEEENISSSEEENNSSEEESNSSSIFDPSEDEIIMLEEKTSVKTSINGDFESSVDIAFNKKIPNTENVTAATTSSTESYTARNRKIVSFGESEKNPLNRSEVKSDDCSCTYEVNDPVLNAYVGNDLLQYGSKVRNDHRVKFRCSNVGYYRFNGSKEIRCFDCKWEISRFPQCELPTFYDAIIVVPDDSQNGFSIGSDGVITVTPGDTLSLRCTTFNTRKCPRWKIRTLSRDAYKINCRPTIWGESNTLTTWYKVYNATERQSGIYECHVPYGNPHYVEVQVRGS